MLPMSAIFIKHVFMQIPQIHNIYPDGGSVRKEYFMQVFNDTLMLTSKALIFTNINYIYTGRFIIQTPVYN